MKNLIRNVIRSFRRNKISIIGLIFLLFFGLGVFTTMSNTTSNIRNEYTSLATKGKLHSFTASELYEIGNASYGPATRAIKYTVSGGTALNFEAIDNIQDATDWKDHFVISDLYAGKSGYATDDGTYFIAIPETTYYTDGETIETYTSDYHIILDVETSTGLYKTFAEQKQDTSYVDFHYRVTNTFDYGEISALKTKLYNLYTVTHPENPEDDWKDGNIEQLAYDNIYGEVYQDFLEFLNRHTQSIFSVMTTTNTPLANHIDEKYANEVDYRFFKSINVTATKDNIYYKIINSNPEDNIDTMVLFSDKNGRNGNQLFSVSDWTPFDSKLVIYDAEGNLIKAGEKFEQQTYSFTIPKDFNEIVETPLYDIDEIRSWPGAEGKKAKFAYSQILRLRFKRMFSADITTDKLDSTLALLSGGDATNLEYVTDLMRRDSDLYNAYKYYFDQWYLSSGESITLSGNGNVVFSWVEPLGTPQTCTISNWTSRFSIVNPQHLKNSGKYVIDPSVLNDFVPYREWYKSTYGYYPNGELSNRSAKEWFNTLNQNQFGFWINPYTKDSWQTMSYSVPGWDSPITVSRGRGSGQWSGIDNKYIADCGGYNQIIWGCGLTPDFMYPVVDITRPTPNTATECLVYCNDSGYNSIKLAFVNSTVEDYLLARFKSNVNTARQKAIIKEINEWAAGAMIFPDNVKCAYSANDTNNMLNCAGFRVAYIPNLVSIIDLVSTILCSFIGILCLVICFVIIKRYVENNRVNIGIMRANGIKKWKIGVSLLPFAFFPALIGGIGAYLAGLFLQAPALSLFSNYWMLPTPLIKFNWISFLACIFLPFIIFGIICFITTLLVLRVNSVELMKSGSEFKTNSFSRIAKKPFKHFGVLTRFRVALAFNSISRLLMLAAMSCLTMSSLVFAFTTFDKLNASRITNSTQFDYSFNLELTTPTSSGSVYSVYDYAQPNPTNPDAIKGLGWSDPQNYIFNTFWNTTKYEGETKPAWATQEGVDYYKNLTKWYALESMSVIDDYDLLDDNYFNAIGGNGNIMYPTATDATGQNEDLLYLQNKICSRLTLDYNIGLPGLASSNPWEIALALMPANSRNIAADSFNNIINEVGHKVADANKAFFEDPEIAALEKTEEHGYIWASDGYSKKTIEETAQIVDGVAKKIGKWVDIYEWNDGNLLEPTYYWRNLYTDYFIYDEKTDTYTLDTNIETVGYLFSSFKTSFVRLIRTIYTDPELIKLEYPITYGTVPLNWDYDDSIKKDETYTYINANIEELSNHHRFDRNEEIKIEGIVQDSEFINLTNKKGENINSYLFSENYLRSKGADGVVHPLIVNAYAAHKYGLKVGTTIKVKANNTVTRYEQQINPDKFKPEDNEATFKVVGISQGTNNAAFYTTQYIANNILGLPDGKGWNKTHRYMMWSDHLWSSQINDLPQLADLSGINANNRSDITIYKFTRNGEASSRPIIAPDTETPAKLPIAPPVGFNGIYTKNKLGKPLTAGLSLYSYTGMYPGASVYSSEGNNKFTEILSNGVNLSIASLMTGIEQIEHSPKAEFKTFYDINAWYLNGPRTEQRLSEYKSYIEDLFVKKVRDVYGDTTMITAICGAMDVAASDLIYNNLISTFNLAETTIMAIVIPITIIIVAIISNLIINDSKKMAAMLKALGYSDAKNLMSILALFVPTIIIGLALAVPLSFGLTLGYQSIIFTSANILVDVTQKWWYYVAAIGGIGIILLGTYVIGYVSIKRDRLVDQIK